MATKQAERHREETAVAEPEEQSAAPPVTGELLRQDQPRQVAKAEDAATAAARNAMKDLGVDLKGVVFEEVQSGGVAKWLDLSAYQEDPNASQNKPVKGNGKFFAGLLIGRFEMPAKDGNGVVNEETGEIVRHYYAIRVAQPTPVQVKDENNESRREMCAIGDVINVGHRHQLAKLKEYSDDIEAGAQIAVVIQPHSRIRIGGGHTMWTFKVQRAVLRHPVKAVLQTAPGR